MNSATSDLLLTWAGEVASELQTKNDIPFESSPVTVDGDEQVGNPSCSADRSAENGCEHTQVEDFPASSESCDGHGPS